MVANLYDERYRTRRRIEALRPPHALSVEAQSYDNEQLTGPEPKEIPLFFVGAFAGAFWVAVAVLAWWMAN
jgi:hypothetical protein